MTTIKYSYYVTSIAILIILLKQQVGAQQQPALPNLLTGSIGGNLKANLDLGLGSFLNVFKGNQIKATTVAPQRTFTRQQIENALYEPNVKCGRVPIFEKQYQRSINETFNANPDGDFRILHGLDAKVGEWPWVVRLKQCPQASCASCTASLLNSRWIITAGHCGFEFIKTPLDKLEGIVGLYDMITPDATSVKVQFDKLIVHPQYRDLNNDLSLLRLKSPIKFNDYIQPLCLINATRNVLAFTKNRKCYTIGYGMGENMMASIKLQKLQILARPPNECNSDKVNDVQLRSGTICIGPANKMGSSCKGDSGGPDHCYDPKTNQWYLIGTVSYGPAVCDRSEDSKWLTVSVDVSNYRTWILTTILANS